MSSYFIFVPIYNLELRAVRELTVERVTFINRERLKRVRSRFGFRYPASQDRVPVFQSADTYAILRSRRVATHPSGFGLVPAEWQPIYESFWILASSFFAYRGRKDAALSLKSVGGPSRDITLINPTDSSFQIGVSGLGHAFPNVLDRWWSRSARHDHFFALQRILCGRVQVKPHWRAALRRSAILCGQSYLARHVAEAFFSNMVAIETLIAKRGDKFPDVLVERLLALFGWLTNEDPEPWHGMIKRLYELRCAYVHDGHSGDVTDADLFDADNLIKNLLRTLCHKAKSIKSKEDLIELARKSQASLVLGKKPRRPGTISYTQPANPTPEDSTLWAR